MYHMTNVGLRELRHNTREIIERARAGEVIVVTGQGRPLAQLTQVSRSPYERMVLTGEITPAISSRANATMPRPGPPLTPVLAAMRQEEQR